MVMKQRQNPRGMFQIQKWKEIVELFSSTFGRVLLACNFNPKMAHFSYIVTKMSNNHPILDWSSHSIVDDNLS